MSSVAVQNIQGILSQQKTAPKPSAAICAIIAGLKDLCEITSPHVEWRRQAQATPTGGGRPTFRNQAASPQPFTRTGSSFSLGSNGSDSPSLSVGGSVSTPISGGAAGSVSAAASASAAASPTARRLGANPRYQSQFKNSSQPVEDKILNNIILSKLNKFCPTTYNDIREFLYQILGSGDAGADLSEMTRQFMLLVFKKAAAEEIYCGLYAKLLSEISQRYGVILLEMHKLQENYLSIFDEVQQKEADEEYHTFIEKNIEKKYRCGYSQFIAELSKFEIINLSCLENTFKRIFECIQANALLPNKETLIEEYIDCLLRMSHVFKKGLTPFITSARKSLITLCGPSIEDILSKNKAHVSVSPKARFILMDVKDNLMG